MDGKGQDSQPIVCGISGSVWGRGNIWKAVVGLGRWDKGAWTGA